MPDEIASAVRAKEQADEAEVAKLVSRGTPVARINTGIDGGMNKVFAAKVPGGNTGLSEDGGPGMAALALASPPGTIPATVNPPHGPVDISGRTTGGLDGASRQPCNGRGFCRAELIVRWLLQQPRPQSGSWRAPMPPQARHAAAAPGRRSENESHREQAEPNTRRRSPIRNRPPPARR